MHKSVNGDEWTLHKKTDCEKGIAFYMGFDKEKIKQIRGLLIFAAGLVLFIIYSGSVVKGIGMCLSILVPFAAGWINCSIRSKASGQIVLSRPSLFSLSGSL